MTNSAKQIESLYRVERSRLEHQINRRVRCHATASDLVQDIFMRIWERGVALTGNHAAYLSRCARNAAIDHSRAESVRKDLLNGLLQSQYAPPIATPLDTVVARQSLRTIDEVLATLPELTRDIFLLNRVHERSFSEIAEVMRISRRSVANHMARALAACEESC